MLWTGAKFVPLKIGVCSCSLDDAIVQENGESAQLCAGLDVPLTKRFWAPNILGSSLLLGDVVFLITAVVFRCLVFRAGEQMPFSWWWCVSHLQGAAFVTLRSSACAEGPAEGPGVFSVK